MGLKRAVTSEFLGLAVVLLAWFCTSAGLIFTNRILMTSGLKAPVSLTVLHMIASFLFANGAIMFGGFEAQPCTSRKQRFHILTLAAAFGVSVVAGVAAFSFIPVSFSEMISSTTPVFTALFACLIVRERSGSWLNSLSLLVVVVGALVATEGEPSWHPVGFTLAVTSTVLRAFKAVIQQVLLQSEEEKMDSINLLRHISIAVTVLLLPMAAAMEGPTYLADIVYNAHLNGDSRLPAMLLLNVSAAFLVNWVQMQVTKMVGATVLQVLGIVKGTLTAFLSILFFRNPVTVSSVSGYITVIVGVFMYHFTYAARAPPQHKPGKELDAEAATPDHGHRQAAHGAV
uniref:Solute carrier family 35 member e4 n=1 Tax=Tetraselmis sp. GSL018 TaxID=582737 RepID=A0A061S762_9CHLO|mmetsp:Transcript_18755/g.44835  ORF Transcript_18755/g.44835 Transcript_18755/m.44835 type:complete len:343 (+) Transcript_18755:312-1340(+)|eukprot:CAMPEP_0177601790 /NCGR_PEP_ID=MMETSP0419_2-20121207/14470_1 /TAXON_ID=582737 /ORGANISM="Tetraselmis sp., Strain GSL018" /LENGTH=342 /DNA_ID=CAMNT_0019095125 /DNA_START=236 /DNA_END=1264 /DNA_ORIENTATION=-